MIIPTRSSVSIFYKGTQFSLSLLLLFFFPICLYDMTPPASFMMSRILTKSSNVLICFDLEVNHSFIIVIENQKEAHAHLTLMTI